MEGMFTGIGEKGKKAAVVSLQQEVSIKQ